jgi:hypothetical protein
VKVGDKVRINFEGSVEGLIGSRSVLVDGADAHYVVFNEHLEVIVSPEDLQAGDVVLDASGLTYLRRDDEMWEEPGNGDVLPDSEAVRPLTLLARDGKAVAQ